MDDPVIRLPEYPGLSVDQGEPERVELGPAARAPAGYTLIRRVAQGGMGSIWLAEHTMLGRRVAIKYIKSTLPTAALSERFCVEAQAAGRLHHPGVASVFDFGVLHGEPYLVMEWLDGTPLDQRLTERRRLSPHEVAALGVNLADTLRAAHAANIVHRDVKPGNIVLVPTAAGEQAKLVDFGIAKLSERSERRLTEMGQPIGSPEYMSPEHVVGSRDIDARADVWGLCVTLYECLVGSSPYAGVADSQLFEAIMGWPVTEPALHDVDDQGLWTILDRGLSKRPSERWQSMAELGQELSSWLLDHGEQADISGQALKRSWTLPPLGTSPAPDLAVAAASGEAVAEIEAELHRRSHADTEDASVLLLVRPKQRGRATAARQRRVRNVRRWVALGSVVLLGALFYAVPLPVNAWPEQVETNWDISVPLWIHAAADVVPSQAMLVATLSDWSEPTPENPADVGASDFAEQTEHGNVVPVKDGGLEPDAHVDAAPAPRKPAGSAPSVR